MGAVQKYLNPITLEAKLFAESLATLSETCDALDVNLVEALDNVMTSIEKFIDKNTKNEIVDTSKTKLVKCDGLQNIQRIYHCSHCKRDLGKAITKVAIHLAEECGANKEARKKTILERAAGRAENLKQNRKDAKGQKEVIKFNKKTIAFLSMDYTNLCNFLRDSVQIGDKLKCLPDYNIIEDAIMEIIKPEFPQKSIKIYKFGSRVSGIGTRESDLDIFIDVGDKFRQYEHRPSKETVDQLHKLHKVMKLRQNIWKCMLFVESARVPIITIMHIKTGIECDINLSNSLGYINTQLLEYIYSLQPIAQFMCIYMKKWMLRTSLKNNMSTYSVNLLVIFYLQQQKFLPPISVFFEKVDMESALTVGPWLSTFVRLTLNDLGMEAGKMSNLMQYIKGFFEFYHNFDYGSKVICTYTGQAIRKDALNSVMPSRYTSYIAGRKDLEIVLNKPMTVQDPIQLDNNVTKGVDECAMRKFKEVIVNSLEIIRRNYKEDAVSHN